MGGRHVVWHSLPWLEMRCRCVVIIHYLGIFRLGIFLSVSYALFGSLVSAEPTELVIFQRLAAPFWSGYHERSGQSDVGRQHIFRYISS